MRSIKLLVCGVIATLALAWQPGRSHAILAVTPEYEFDMEGSYSNIVTDPPYSGSIFVLGNPTDSILSADIFLPSPGLEFKHILSQGLNSGQYDLNLEDTTNSFELELVIDTPADLFNGLDGATVDTTSQLVTFPGNLPIGGSFSGTLDIPAPPALPVFVSALGLLGFARRRKKSVAV